MNDRFAAMPEPPYYAVLFSNQLSDTPEGYAEMADQMDELAKTMPGYIGRESSRDETGFAMTVSYWTDEAAIAGWKAQVNHAMAQKMGQERWYAHYRLRIARIERQYSGPEGRSDPTL